MTRMAGASWPVIAGFLATLSISTNAHAVGLTLCGVTDNSEPDLDPTSGTVSVIGCVLPGGGQFSGTAAESYDSGGLYRILVSPAAFRGSDLGSILVEGRDLNFAGPGTLGLTFEGVLQEPVPSGVTTSGTEFFQFLTIGTAFDGIGSSVGWGSLEPGLPLPIDLADDTFQTSGNYLGSGNLQIFVRYNLTPGEEFFLPDSISLDAEVVPEPATLFSVGIGLFGAIRCRRRKRTLG